jgi:hypothetical protein
MKTIKIVVALFFIGMSLNIKAQEQNIPVIRDVDTPILEPLRLSGPRVGLTLAPNIGNTNFSSVYSDSSFSIDPFITQFGWQFEWKYFETVGGSAGLFEVIPMIGGLDQGLFLPSLNLITGFRSSEGFEVGAGPNLSILNSGFTAAIGYVIKSKHMNFPINFAVTKSKDQLRWTILFGFTKRRR